MKPSLIAAAALLAAFGAAAQQQEEGDAALITTYGVLDAGVARIRSGASGKVRFASASLMNNGASRFGLRAQEDMGGGLAVGFNVETGFDLEDGATTGGAFWARQANLWMGGKWGAVRLGRQLAPSYEALYAFEVTGDAGYSALANTYGYAGMPARLDSAISFTSPRVDGWQTTIAAASKNNTGSRGDVWDVGMTYVGRRYATGIALNQGADGKGRLNWLAGVRYELGDGVREQLALAASYARTQRDGSHARREGMSLGALLRTGPAHVALDVVRDRKNETPGHAGKKYTNAVLEGRYYLSPRSFVYGAALRLDGKNNWGVGLRHNF